MKELTEKQKYEFKLAKLASAVEKILWMARRYANGRQTYAPDMFNDAYDVFRTEFGSEIDVASTWNQKGEPVYDISIEHSNIHPYAVYGHNEDSQTNQEIKHREFYIKPVIKKDKNHV